ncbi:unnamed protein product [Prunus brigantina]
MPFGLKNAGATYQRLVNHIFAELIGTSMEVYVDDMLVKSRTANDHLRNLSLMFGKLKQYNMRLNPSKCAFGVASGKFLGFMISQRGIEANLEKIRALIDMRVGSPPWPVSYPKPPIDLKTYMSIAPLLSTPLPGEQLTIYLSVSASALSSVLIRQPNGIELPIFYMSHALQDAEQRLENSTSVITLGRQKKDRPWPISFQSEDDRPSYPSAFADSSSAETTFDHTFPHWTLYVDGSSNR